MGAGCRVVVEANLTANQKVRPGCDVPVIAGAPDRLVPTDRRRVGPLYHHFGLVGGGVRRVVGLDVFRAIAQDVLDFGISGRQRPRRPHACRAQRNRSRQNKTRREFSYGHNILRKICRNFTTYAGI